jgi:hypothetical protein
VSVSGNYSQPVMVNGYQCWNCTEVGEAKKHIDPQHPKSGPYGIDAAQDPSLRNNPQAQRAVQFGGSLTAPASSAAQNASVPGSPPVAGGNLDVTA